MVWALVFWMSRHHEGCAGGDWRCTGACSFKGTRTRAQAREGDSSTVEDCQGHQIWQILKWAVHVLFLFLVWLILVSPLALLYCCPAHPNTCLLPAPFSQSEDFCTAGKSPCDLPPHLPGKTGFPATLPFPQLFSDHLPVCQHPCQSGDAILGWRIQLPTR